MRLEELEQEDFIKRIENQKSPMIVRWALTKKGGEDTLPILMRFCRSADHMCGTNSLPT